MTWREQAAKAAAYDAGEQVWLCVETWTWTNAYPIHLPVDCDRARERGMGHDKCGPRLLVTPIQEEA